MKNILYCVWQCTWGILQTMLGFFVFLCNFKCRHYLYHGAVVTEWNDKSSVSLGMFVFVTKEPYFYKKLKDEYEIYELSSRLLVHEYGHTIQLQELGVWDYYKYVVKPSVSRYNKTKDGPYSWDSYYSTPWEYQADQYGGVTRNYKPWASESSERYWDRVNSLRN